MQRVKREGAPLSDEPPTKVPRGKLDADQLRALSKLPGNTAFLQDTVTMLRFLALQCVRAART